MIKRAVAQVSNTAFVLIFLGILWLFFLMLIQRDYALCLIEEGGPIENATALFLFLGSCICIIRIFLNSNAIIFWGEFALLFFLMAIRELDVHRRISGYNFLRIDFYTNENIFLITRLFSALILFICFLIIIHFVLSNFRSGLAALKKRQLWTISAMGFFIAESSACIHHKIFKSISLAVMLALGKTPGLILENEADFFVEILEETFEFIAAILLCITAKQIPDEFTVRNKPNSS
ncbi:MAG: hypothetical protein P9M03_11150 [Candidatus Theseobacter exili]|nr:hypothetical protein [Candidatus Theseobacter exili]